MRLTILYRGPLSSCNYGCAYCPFAKHQESAGELAADRRGLERFTAWVAGRAVDDRLSILLTPWGEALYRDHYQRALSTLSWLPQVTRVAIQTNLSGPLDWLADCDPHRLALWCTFHPTETTRDRFLARCGELDARGVPYSVGVVGLREHEGEIAALRASLPGKVYLWINAYKDRHAYYDDDAVARLTAIDPHFPTNLVDHPSRGEPCRAGASAISVDGDGTVRRCHFIAAPIGNLYDEDFADCLRERPCSNDTCGCHIGYVHLDRLRLGPLYGDGLLPRIPVAWPAP